MANSEPYVNIEIGGIRQDAQGQGIRLEVGHIGRLSFPVDFPLNNLQTAQKDFELIAAKLRDSPDRVQKLVRAVVSGQNSEVRELAEELGLRESDFQAQGGGILPAVVVIAVFCCAGAAY
jgi:hypothetical protein